MVEETDPYSFDGWLRERMRARRLSQRQLAARAGVHHSTISRLLRGAAPTLVTARALQAALDPRSAHVHVRDSPELHPAILAMMLRQDGFLTSDDIDRLISVYVQLVAARPRRPAASLPIAGRATRMR